jgi:hypothetical protein
MRTTVTIEDDAVAIARELAEESGRTLGQAITFLIRAGSRAMQEEIEYPGDFRPAPRRPREPLITSERIRKLDEESW